MPMIGKKIWWCWFWCSSCVERKILSEIHIKFLKFELFEGFYQLKNWKRDETFCILRTPLNLIQIRSGYCSTNVRATFHNNTFAYLCTKLNKIAKYMNYHEPVENPLIIITLITIGRNSQDPISPVSLHGNSKAKVLARTTPQIFRPGNGVGQEIVTCPRLIYIGVVAPPTLERDANNRQIFISKLALCQRVLIHQALKSGNYVAIPDKHSALYGWQCGYWKAGHN